jgi:hypothetical protein
MNKEQPEMKKEIKAGDWEDIESSSFTKFENIGDSIEGMLYEKALSDRYGFGLYTIVTKDGERKRFHGTKQLDDLMQGVNLQDYIQVVYIDDQKTEMGSMKLFEVKRKKEK